MYVDDNDMLIEHKKRYLRVAAKLVSPILSHDYTCTDGIGDRDAQLSPAGRQVH